MSNNTEPLTRDQARRRVAELQGWQPGSIPTISANEIVDWNESEPDDCFDPGNAVRLLWELPEGWHYRHDDNEFCIVEVKYHGQGVYRTFLTNHFGWFAKTPEEFATAAVSAFLTAHTGKRIEIKD